MDSIDLLHSIFNKRETLYTLKDFETIINQAHKKDCEIDYFEGCLLDNAVIYAENKNLFIGCKKRKYIILE